MVLALTLATALLHQDKPGIDLALAARYFQEAKWIADDDAGVLWGKRLDGPMMFADRATGTVVTNEDPPEMGLRPENGVFVGKLPPTIGIANTATDWKGRKWTMLAWPPPANRTERARLMMHELWHRMQGDIGLPGESPANAHLDTMQGRIWLQLEVRALLKALEARPDEMRPYQEDALTFRAYRQSLVAGAKREEDRMEVHEGMAEFTGQMLRGTWEPESRRAFAYLRKGFGSNPSFPTSFAYTTGPSYGFLLDILKEGWRKTLTPRSSVADLVAEAIGFHPAQDLKADAERRAVAYGSAELITAEAKREAERAARKATYRRLMLDGPVLELALQEMNYTWDPNDVFPLGSDGTVYPNSSIIDVWGRLTAKGGARITSDHRHAYVPAPLKAGDLMGEGWTLELNPGWKIVPGRRAGDFRLEKTRG